ncbi:type II toxin-antitoxin system RelB family antitoxin [Nosocomiicoccus massiliensis]|uniref:type II toxin-antitoxin system RelB family antitoxin n=1 Tax=Nosocomiicoccus massiliensis TaxID=1232430 RepID=UPI0004252F5D|nr:DUF6290 family protein [Nosocomiicoccus massiliensis]
MHAVNIPLTDEEYQLFNEYAQIHNIPLSTMLKETLKEKIEDDFDVALIREYENEKNTSEVSYTHDEVKEILKI